MRQRRPTLYCLALFLVGLVGCSKDPTAPSPAPAAPDLKVGTVSAALTNPVSCPATGSCIVYPDRDTTVYQTSSTKDYGKGHELCVGIGGGNGLARALLHFDLTQLPAKVIATAATLTIRARRTPADTGTLDLFRITSGVWSEGTDAAGLADGHAVTADCPTCAGTGPCGWSGVGAASHTNFAQSLLVGAKITGTAFTLGAAGTTTVITFTGLATDVRAQAAGSNFGFSIRANNETLATSKVVFWSNDTLTGNGNKPQLNVTYGKGPGSACVVNGDCLFANGTAGDCAGGFCCTAACDDGKSCTTDACNSSGACSSTPNNGVCNDSNVCTTDTCNPASGSANVSTGCVNANNAISCDDSNACTQTDTCSLGSCVGSNPIVCSALDQCHNAGTCSGGVCSNPIKTNGTSCDDANACTTGETCQAGSCTNGTPVVCSALDQCHNAGTCSGGVCSNPIKTNGTTCDDANGCTVGDTCQTGTCTSGSAVVCSALDQCHNAGACSGGVCSNPIKTNGTGCDDGNSCTSGEACQAGSCTGGSGTVCTALDQCHTAGTCSGGVCSNPIKTNGTSCNDGDSCTQTDTCQAGTCTGSNPVVCTALDQCHSAGTCSGGVCSNPIKTNGTSCDDANSCTSGEACQAGSCTGGSGTVCTALDQCHTAGTCSGGVCSNPIKTNGTSCNDGNACTQTDTCQAGTCTGANPVVCTALDQCHTAGTCSGGVCSNPIKTNGTSCNDGDSCTQTDTCQAGTCTGASPIVCTALDQCHTAGTCSGGVCSNPTKSDGSSCNDANACTQTDTCQGGTCTGGNPVVCTALDQCHSAGACSGGTCSNPIKTNGTSCNDGDACTQTDTCQAGTCTGASPVVCTALDQCHTAGTCSSGVCSNPIKTNGTSCNDGDSCTQTDTCQAGTCTGASPVVCTALDQCHTAGTCSSGVCSNPIKTNGTSCNDGNACTQTDTCQAGTCTGGNPVVCTALDQCHNAGTCSGGVCSNPIKTNGTACNDALTCNVGETCQAGTCAGGTALDCSASADQCHSGACQEPSGCVAQPLNGNSCDDGSACTVGEKCNAGTCGTGAGAGTALGCDDGNPCTTDSCNPGSGCVHSNVANGTGCGSDGNVCTLDTCVAGVCHTPVTNGTTCGVAPSCSGSIPNAQAVPPAACAGGVCSSQAPVACGATTPCNGTACQGTCSADNQCTTGFFCNLLTTQCEAVKGPGGSCLRDTMCQGGTACVDTVCCTSACGGGVVTDCVTCNGASPGTCTNQTGTSCNDGVFCNGADTCATGACTTHAGNPCAGADGDGNCAESCSETNDNCFAADPNNSPCDDGLFCNVGEACQAGVCTGGGQRDCSVFTNQCNTGVCNEGGNSCQASPISGTSCTDNNTCTTTDQCLSGVCQAGPALSCDDSNICTSDSCVPASGCAHANVANGTGCGSDGNGCTLDTCLTGLCHTPIANGTSCGSPASCSGTIPNASAVPPGTCSGGNCSSQTPVPCGATVPCNGTGCQGGCTQDNQCPSGFFCNTTGGLNQCQSDKAPGGSCSRDAMCQAGTTCVDTVCCTSACGGGVATDCVTCNGATPGTCTNQTGTACDDGTFCNGTDACAAGLCTVHVGSPCAGADGDGNCAESCNETAKNCLGNDPNGSACDDGLFCTVSDKCNGSGVCAPGVARDCSAAGNQCNTGVCDDAIDACKGNPLSGQNCNDGDACTTNDKCDAAGACKGGGATNCNDNKVCTTDSCVPATGCVNTNNTASCDDGNACTTNDKCSGGLCVGGAALTCNDNNSCTNDACVPATGCSFTNANGNTCSDSNACTAGDHCTAGACVSSGATNCDDGNPCTDDTCSAQGGCAHTANTLACDDGNKCTTNDVCAGSTCTGGPALVCDDGKSCTDDSCSPAIGCVFTNDNANICTDGNACTGSDHCASGVCVGSAIVCNDQNPCTDDSCAPATGCVTTNNTVLCNDGDACTISDRCLAGTCVGGATPVCDDGNPCTVDTCNSATGCVFPAGHAGTSCRLPAGICDVPEVCDGTNANCPTDRFDGSTTCSPASCTGGQETLAGVCKGAGPSCPTAIVTACAPFACGASACLKACTVDGECSVGNYCAANGKCSSKGGPGAVCSAGNQCQSSFCTDGVCCNSDCGSQCEACNIPGTVGTCSPVSGPPVGSRPVCPGDGTGCDGICNGVVTTSCTVPGQTEECRAASCDGPTHTATLREFCDGLGSCPSKRTQDCSPGICGATQCAGCSTNSDCPTGDFCRGGVCKPLAGNGTTCSIDAECSSGHCVDTVCCNNDCTGQCEACNQPNQAGTCVAIAKDQPPAKGRPPCVNPLEKCGGSCDGTNRRSCVYPGLGVVCHDPICTNGVASLVAFCDGAGICPPADQQACPTGSTCDGSLCAGGPNSCAGDGDCNSSQYCAAGICIGKKAAGVGCNTSGECQSSVCIDGVCCTRGCTGQCEACNVEGSKGTCVAVIGAPRGSRQPCTSDGSDCGGSCDGVTADRCDYPGAETSCRVGKCAANLADLAANCQGNGSCAPLQQQSCDPVGCDSAAVACAGPCKVDGECTQGQYCSAGMCVAQLPNGAPCATKGQCTNANCVDGVCCNSACNGQCQSCDQAGSLGTCIAVPGAPRNGRPACAGSGSCGGFCDGTSGVECTLPGLTTTCGVEFCSGSSDTPAPKCGGNATCIIPASQSCDPYRCDDQGSTCLTTCELDTDCAPGLVCITGGCSQPVPDAGTPPVDAGAGAGGVPSETGGATSVDAGSGTPDTGGAPAGGRGGATGTGGRGGISGTPSTGGRITSSPDAGVGGEPVGDGGPGKDAGAASSGDTGSCGCRVPGTQRRSTAGMVALAGLVLFAAARRRRRRPDSREQSV